MWTLRGDIHTRLVHAAVSDHRIFQVLVIGGGDFFYPPGSARTISRIQVVFFLPIGGWTISHLPTTELRGTKNNH